MTRVQAKKGWCPFALALVAKGGLAGGPATGNRHPDGEVSDACRCIADACLAWREYLEDPASGYCGLAGSQGAP